MAEDVAYVLFEYLQSLDNLPFETKHFFDEITVKEMAVHELFKRIKSQDKLIQNFVKSNGALTPYPREENTFQEMEENYQKAIQVQKEKVDLAERARALITRHIKKLDAEMKKVGFVVVPGEKGQVDVQLPYNAYGSSLSSRYSNGTGGPIRSSSASSTRRRSSTTHGATASKAGRSVGKGTRGKNVSSTASWNNDYASKERSESPSTHTKASATPSVSGAAAVESTGEEEEDTEVYCFCQQGSFGQMVACDDEGCEREWFHMECVGLKAPPEGTWYCETCKERRSKAGLPTS
ncbi:ING family Png1 [Schizosaccharomyces japonicus yFS275]|uniref:Chromatin modification-related protein n=1 Tax=Schizosaccharomyces japonicus (strain yFS275 / FY16936) TaxID=402676 RepID=B6K4R6_SCHJY|nr:ING family Png1 [Schizosaccharomyces japonicus yFS275]EEB08473.1 ING family Png1 [Schizosaccharomyces japonicus yFS275]